MAKTLTKAGRYQIVGELGRGSMGVVYQGFDPIIGRTVAIKTLLTEGLASSEFEEYKARFQREAQAAGVLTHPNIVTVYDFGDDGGILYLAMEFLEGKSLQQLAERQGVLPIETIIPMYEQVCAALDHAHSHKIVHRDVKPANIMILESGLVKVTDFGIAKVMSTGMTQAGQILGTPNYMSPEQVKGRPVDGRSDIFSLGVILYELVTGEKPFGGQNITTVIYKIINENPIPPRELDPTVHLGLSYIIQKALAKNPDERYQTCRELAEDMKSYRGLGGAPAPSATLVVRVPPIQGTPVEPPAPMAPTRFSAPPARPTPGAVAGEDYGAGVGPVAGAPARLAAPPPEPPRISPLAPPPSLAPTSVMPAPRIVPPPPPPPVPRPQVEPPRVAPPAPRAAPVRAPAIAKPQPEPTSPAVWIFLSLIVLAAVGAGGYYFGFLHKPSNPPINNTAGGNTPVNPNPAGTSTSGAGTAGSATGPGQTSATGAGETTTATPTGGTTPGTGPGSSTSKGHSTTSTETPAATTGRLEVNSRPQGATITLDGNTGADWVTPHTFPDLDPGPHQVTLAMDGYDSANESVQVKAGQVARLNPVLKATGTGQPNGPTGVTGEVPAEGTGVVSFVSDPPGAEIFIEGKSYGPAPVRNIRLKFGTYSYRVVLEGRPPIEATFDLSEDQPVIIKREIFPK